MASNSFSRIFIKLAANVGCVIMGYSFYEYDTSFYFLAVLLMRFLKNLGCTRKKTVWENMKHSNSKSKQIIFILLDSLYYDSYVRHKKRMGQEFTDDDYSEEDRKYVEEHCKIS